MQNKLQLLQLRGDKSCTPARNFNFKNIDAAITFTAEIILKNILKFLTSV